MEWSGLGVIEILLGRAGLMRFSADESIGIHIHYTIPTIIQ
jgi:hypothetical protein